MADFRKLLRNASLLCCALAFTTACTNDESNDFAENYSTVQESSKVKRHPHKTVYTTLEDINKRMEEINTKYNVTMHFVDNCNGKYEVPEDFFLTAEHTLKRKLGLIPSDSLYICDCGMCDIK